LKLGLLEDILVRYLNLYLLKRTKRGKKC